MPYGTEYNEASCGDGISSQEALLDRWMRFNQDVRVPIGRLVSHRSGEVICNGVCVSTVAHVLRLGCRSMSSHSPARTEQSNLQHEAHNGPFFLDGALIFRGLLPCIHERRKACTPLVRKDCPSLGSDILRFSMANGYPEGGSPPKCPSDRLSDAYPSQGLSTSADTTLRAHVCPRLGKLV